MQRPEAEHRQRDPAGEELLQHPQQDDQPEEEGDELQDPDPGKRPARELQSQRVDVENDRRLVIPQLGVRYASLKDLLPDVAEDGVVVRWVVIRPQREERAEDQLTDDEEQRELRNDQILRQQRTERTGFEGEHYRGADGSDEQKDKERCRLFNEGRGGMPEAFRRQERLHDERNKRGNPCRQGQMEDERAGAGLRGERFAAGIEQRPQYADSRRQQDQAQPRRGEVRRPGQSAQTEHRPDGGRDHRKAEELRSAHVRRSSNIRSNRRRAAPAASRRARRRRRRASSAHEADPR